MPESLRTRVIPLFDQPVEGEPLPAIEIALTDEKTEGVTFEDGALKVEQPDGSLIIDLNPDLSGQNKDGDWDENLALKIEPAELSRIASELLTNIDADEQSRKEWLENRARIITLLGLKLEDPRSTADTGAGLEGISVVRHPMLLEACLRFAANARGELLPASGPVKVRNDTPPKPEPPRGMPPMPDAEPLQKTEDLATALEVDFNHWLTSVATEYYPDTDRMLFYIGFGGLGIKKVFHCPLRRRPASDSVDAENFIVSNAITDLTGSGRITERIKMRPSTLKRMQIVGAYRDVAITLAPAPIPTPVEKKVEEIQGTKQPMATVSMQDIDQVIYETYCELDIKGYEHKGDGKVTGLYCPYKVTIHKESREVLEVRRNWKEGDDLCIAKQYFVDYLFAPGLGFYPIGLGNLLGNLTTALTAAWRLMLDSGMFANFPGGLIAKQATRQNTNQFRVAPGEWKPVETGTMRIQDMVMAMPYKEVGAAFVAFIQHLEEMGARLASSAQIQMGVGKQEVPVGTTLAMIEQATKIMDAIHKRLHESQAREFALLKERFKEDPSSFWRHNKRPTIKWQEEQFIAALENSEIVPVADPNNPTSLHRIAKAVAVKTLQQGSPALYDPMNVDKRVMRIVGIDPEGLFRDTPAPPPPDPRMAAVQAKKEAEQIKGMINYMET